MERDRVLPELEIELHRVESGGKVGEVLPPRPKRSKPALGRKRSGVLIAGATVAAAAVLIVVIVFGDRSSPPHSTPVSLPASTTIAASESIRPATSGLLGATNTGLLMWSFDSDARLQVLDLDSGQTRLLGSRSGVALYGLRGHVVIYDPNTGSRVVDATGRTRVENLGRGVSPVVGADAQSVWTLSDATPSRWQRRFVDGSVADEIPFDATVSLFPYDDRTVLVVAADGTSQYDFVTHQQRPLTASRLIAAQGHTLIGRSCRGGLCYPTVIDPLTLNERTLFEQPSNDYNPNTVTLSPDGRYLAIFTHDSPSIIDVATGKTIWQSPTSGWYADARPAWSWSPDSARLFYTTNSQRVVAVDIADRPVTHIDIALQLEPTRAIAVTRR